MHIFCKLKEKTDKAKKARALLSNRNKIKNFIIKLELNGKIIYEKVDNEYHIEALPKVVELFYSNHLDIILSSFNALGLQIKDGYSSNISLEVIDRYINAKKFVVSYKLYDRWAKDYEGGRNSHRTTMNPVFVGTVNLDKTSFLNSYPNFCLVFSDITLKLDYFIQLLHKIKKEFSDKKIEDIYNYALDIFIEVLEKKMKARKKYLAVSFANLSTIVYYNFRIMFRHDNQETAFLSFKEIGWSWEASNKKREAEIYTHDEYDIVEEVISKKIFDRIKKEYSISDEYAWHVIGYILYRCIVNLVMTAREEYNKTLNEMFFDNLMTSVEAHIKRIRGYHHSKHHFIVIPKDTTGFSLSSKQKGILLFINHLFSIVENERIYQKIKNKLEKIAAKIRFEEDAVCIYFDYERDDRSIEINVSRCNIDNDYVLIGIQDEQEYYAIEIDVYSDFYHINKKIFERALSSTSISTFLELVGINKHNFEFVLRNIETEFVDFD